MNPHQQQQPSQGPSTPQRIFPNNAMNQGRPITIANQQFNNRSFSPQTPSSSQSAHQQLQMQQQQQQQPRTPIQLMQQQTKQLVNSPSNISISNPAAIASSNDRKRILISSTNVPGNTPVNATSLSSPNPSQIVNMIFFV
jgi:hypothetical protein